MRNLPIKDLKEIYLYLTLTRYGKTNWTLKELIKLQELQDKLLEIIHEPDNANTN